MADALASSQEFCAELRKAFPRHVYRNDRQIVDAMERTLSQEMRLPKWEEEVLIELIRRRGPLAWHSYLLCKVRLLYPKHPIPDLDGHA